MLTAPGRGTRHNTTITRNRREPYGSGQKSCGRCRSGGDLPHRRAGPAGGDIRLERLRQRHLAGDGSLAATAVELSDGLALMRRRAGTVPAPAVGAPGRSETPTAGSGVAEALRCLR